MKKLVIGNWKMNPSTLDEAKKIIKKTRRIAGRLQHTEVIACPPLVFVFAVISKRDPNTLKIGAQTVSYEEDGPHTGEVSAVMLSDIGVKYVIAGHSEERKNGDTDKIVSRRVKAIVDSGMRAVVCVGEEMRDEGGKYLEILKDQIRNSLAGIPQSRAKNIILAYEPVWAIGDKEAMRPDQIYEMSIFVKKIFSDIFSQDQAMKVVVLYGGSVNFRNAADIIKTGKVDGLLVGRESVNLPGFIELLKAVDGVK
ncbi:MAG: triose-phosphate isomerase [Patescibacteria group bacterium]